MKVFFDTNLYVAEALLGEAAEQIVQATQDASWRIYTCCEQLDELERVLTDEFGVLPKTRQLVAEQDSLPSSACSARRLTTCST